MEHRGHVVKQYPLAYDSDAFKEIYRKRAGVEGTISQATRTSNLRQSCYIGLEKTHFQNLAIAAALNLARVVAWLNEVPWLQPVVRVLRLSQRNLRFANSISTTTRPKSSRPKILNFFDHCENRTWSDLQNSPRGRKKDLPIREIYFIIFSLGSN